MIALMTEFQIFHHFVGRFNVAGEVPWGGVDVLSTVLKHQVWPNQKRSVEMSYAQISNETGLSRASIIRSLTVMAQLGYIQMSRKSKSRTAPYRYRVTIPESRADDFLAATVSHLGRVAARMINEGLLSAPEDAVENSIAGIRDSILAGPLLTEPDLESLRGRIEVRMARSVNLSK